MMKTMKKVFMGAAALMMAVSWLDAGIPVQETVQQQPRMLGAAQDQRQRGL